MARIKMVAGNWKMNKNLQEGVALATELKEAVKSSRELRRPREGCLYRRSKRRDG